MATRQTTACSPRHPPVATPADLWNSPGALGLIGVEAGDTCYTQTPKALWLCEDPTPGAAVWVLAGGKAAQLVLDVTSTAQLGVASHVLTPATQARANSNGTFLTPTAGESFDVTVDGGSTYTISFLGTETTPALAVDRINARWQALSGETTRIAYINGTAWNALFLCSPTAGATSTLDLAENTGTPLADMGFAAAPYTLTGVAAVAPVHGSFARSDVTVSSFTLAAADAFDATVDGVGPHTLVLAGGTYSGVTDYQLLADEINTLWQTATASTDEIAFVDASGVLFFASSIAGASGSLTLVDGANTPLATMGATAVTPGVNANPTVTATEVPAAVAYPEVSDIPALKFHADGMASGATLWPLTEELPFGRKCRIRMSLITGFNLNSVADGRVGLGLSFYGDTVRDSGVILVVKDNRTNSSSSSIGVLLDQQVVGAVTNGSTYAYDIQVDLDPLGLSAFPIPNCPLFDGRMTVYGNPPLFAGGSIGVSGNLYSHFSTNGGGWTLGGAAPTNNKLALVLLAGQPSLGEVDFYLTKLTIEILE